MVQSPQSGPFISSLYWLSEDQIARLRPYFPKSHGIPCVDDRPVLSSIIFINRNGLRWCDAPKEYDPTKTLYNRWKRWSDMDVFARIMEGLANEAPDNNTISIDAIFLKAHRTASSWSVKRGNVDVWLAALAVELTRSYTRWPTRQRDLSDFSSQLVRWVTILEPEHLGVVCQQSIGWSRTVVIIWTGPVNPWRQGHNALYTGLEVAQQSSQVQQTPLQKTQPDWHHVWPI